MARSPSPDPALGTALRKLRTERKLSQESVSHAADISLCGYGKIERNEVAATWTTVRAIAGALGISMQELGAAVDRQR
jgi:transcriptional regulator with XRE-family HTH domain